MFVKLFQQILDSSIADDRRLRHFFTDLLLCADSTGLVMMTHGAIARRIGADLEEVEWGLNALMQPDPLSKTPDAEGRRIEALEGTGYGWRILNYEHYRAMKDAEQLRETTRERVRRFRAKKAAEIVGNADVTPCNAMQKEKKKQKQIQKPDEESEEFSQFWTAYPRKEAKAKALEAWNKNTPPIEEVLAALKWQTKKDDWTKEGGKYIPMPTSYLNARRWTDERPKPKTTQPQLFSVMNDRISPGGCL